MEKRSRGEAQDATAVDEHDEATIEGQADALADVTHADVAGDAMSGEPTVTLDGRTVTRQQFGSQKVKRSRSSGTPLDIGFDLKGAATDALKKCASLIGVALYLWKKEPPAGLGNGGVPTNAGQNGANGSYGGGNPNGMHVIGG